MRQGVRLSGKPPSSVAQRGPRSKTGGTPPGYPVYVSDTSLLFSSSYWKTASSTILRPTRSIIKACEIVGGGREGVAAEGKTNGTSADGLSGVARCSALTPSVVGQGPRAVISAALE